MHRPSSNTPIGKSKARRKYIGYLSVAYAYGQDDVCLQGARSSNKLLGYLFEHVDNAGVVERGELGEVRGGCDFRHGAAFHVEELETIM